MMKRVLILLLGMLLLTCTALAEMPAGLIDIEPEAFTGDEALTGVMTLPDTVRSVGSRAFAATGLHALIVPGGCLSLAGDALAGAQAAYVMLEGMDTAITGSTLTDVPYVFAPENSAFSGLEGFYAAETLCVSDGIFFSVGEEEALPLCAVAPLTGEVILPKLVDGQPVRKLDTLVLQGCADAAFLVPSYLELPAGMQGTTYASMSVSAPVADVTEINAGDPITWTTEALGAYGDVSYVWLFDVDGVVSSVITAEPTVTWTPMREGLCVATVTAVDALGDKAEASSEGVTVGPAIPVYRALLVGNTYPGTQDELAGCDTDVYAMRSMLGSMQGTDFSVTARINLTADEIQGAIASTFAGARPCDVSLFYFSGHGRTDGCMVGIGNSFISPGALRNWLDKIPGTKIVIIDCCYSGRMIGKAEGSASTSGFTSAFISSFSSFNKANNLANNGYIVMTACSMTQVSSSLTSVSPDGSTVSFGAFTYGVCHGSGYDEWNSKALGYMPADTNGDGSVTLGEAYGYAVERVAWLNTLLPADYQMEQSAQYYGDSSFVLWTLPAVAP